MKRKILVLINKESAVDYFRFIMSIKHILKSRSNIDIKKLTEISDFNGYDIVHFHANYLMSEQFRYLVLNSKGIKFIMDVDDYWELPKTSPYYEVHKVKDYIYKFLPIVDAVTTTTKLFKNELKKYNKNVYVFPNCIDKSINQYQDCTKKSKRLRVGFIGGASHLYDLKLLEGLTTLLSKELENDIQLVLCGFDTTGLKRAEFSIWNEFEQIFTNDYSILDERYMEYLCNYQLGEYPNVENQPYRRFNSKNVYEYATLYNEIDILLAPLENNKFNCMKSELKAIEAGTMNKVIICSNVGINKEVLTKQNAILIDNSKGVKEWAKAIKSVLYDVNLRNSLKNNLNQFINTKYDIEKICEGRINLYDNI